MKKSQASRYARWSAAVAIVLAAITVGVYLKRGYTRYVEHRNAPPAAPVNVERQSTVLTFSKVEGQRTVFTVEASKSTEFKGLNAMDLEGVRITIFGRDGARHDTMETHACRYTKDSGDMDCSGDVQIVLMSEEEWKSGTGKSAAPGVTPGTMKIETRGVAFNRTSGEAKTDQEVRFAFSNGTGRATGAEYHADQGALRLQRNVVLHLTPAVPPGSATRKASLAPAEPVEVTGSRMDFSRDTGTMYLSGPAEAHTQNRRLTAAALLLELGPDFHAKRLLAKSGENAGSARPEFTSTQRASTQHVTANEMSANFSPQGWVTGAEASGQVAAVSQGPGEKQDVKAEFATADMFAGKNQPRRLVLKGAVDARTVANATGAGKGADSRHLTSDELQLEFAENGRNGVRLASALTPRSGRIEWNESPLAPASGGGPGKSSQTVVQANQLAMQFDNTGKASRLNAVGNVQTERTAPGSEKQTATAKSGFVEMNPAGGWSRMDLTDDVHLNEGSRAAQADHAVFTRADQSMLLTGRATVRDATSLTSAQKINFWQYTGDMRAEGGVHSTDLSARNGPVRLAPVPANISSDNLSANNKTGRAIYTGHARLWQGESVMEADSIEILKNERVLNASGNVNAVFPQAPASAATSPGPASAAPSGPRPPVLWHAQSAHLTYWDLQNRARLDQNVFVQSPDEKMSSAALELFFARAPASPAANGNAGTAASPLPGAQQISRAVATGGVVVQQDERRATAERGEYTASDGKFVMTGGTPTIFDASEGTTTGRQLTFFLADATIIVDSENGSRTLTRHRVEK